MRAPQFKLFTCPVPLASVLRREKVTTISTASEQLGSCNKLFPRKCDLEPETSTRNRSDVFQPAEKDASPAGSGIYIEVYTYMETRQYRRWSINLRPLAKQDYKTTLCATIQQSHGAVGSAALSQARYPWVRWRSEGPGFESQCD